MGTGVNKKIVSIYLTRELYSAEEYKHKKNVPPPSRSIGSRRPCLCFSTDLKFKIFLQLHVLKASMSLPGGLSKVLNHGRLLQSKFVPFGSITVRGSKIWEPDYLILGKTKTPEFDLLNVQIKGYDFATLENYQKLIKKIAFAMKINVVRSWTAPQQDLLIHHYKPNSADIEYKYDLKLYERNIQILDVKSNIMSLFIEALMTACPPGVQISLHEHEEHMDEDRYIPSLAIAELQEKLDNISSDVKKKKK